MNRLDLAKELRSQIEANLTATRSMIRIDELSESELAEMVDIYPDYKRNYEYKKAGEIFKHDGKLYAIKQPHTTQDDWMPADLPALYRPLMPDDVVAEWDPDRDYSANPFQPGERIIWTDDKIYESIHSSPHAWTPADYPAAWKVIE